jgi:hypothetical protein
MLREKYLLELKLHGLPETTNSGGRKHWWVKTREAKKWIDLVCIETIGKRPSTPLVSAHLVLTRCSSAEPDFDGLVSSFKHVIDGLIHAGIIVNDKQSTIGQPRYCWEKAPPRGGHIKVRVEGYL